MNVPRAHSQDIKRKIIRNVALGYSYKDTATRMGITPQRVQQVMVEVRKDLHYNEKDINMKGVVEQTLSMYDQIIKDADKEYRASTNSKDKASYLRLISDLQQAKLKILQRLGVLYEKPTEIDFMAKIQKQTMEYIEIHKTDVKEYNAKAEILGAEIVKESEGQEVLLTN